MINRVHVNLRIIVTTVAGLFFLVSIFPFPLLAENGMGRSSSITGSVGVGELLTYTFSANKDEAIHISVVDTDAKSHFTPQVWLYAPNGRVVIQRRESMVVTFDCHTTSTSCRIKQSGIYRLVVADYSRTHPGNIRIEFLNVTKPGPTLTNQNNAGMQEGSDGVLPVTGATSPTTDSVLNSGKRGIVKDLMNAYADEPKSINTVANFADQAVLAWAAYDGNDEKMALELARERGWQTIGEYRYQHKLSGDTVAKLFQNQDTGKAILAFRGTQVGRDWVTNINSAANIPGLRAQIADTKRIAKKVAAEYPDVAFTGHSLGGRLAQIARFETGGDAVVFNSAPLGVSEIDDSFIESLKQPRSQMLSFASPQDPLRDTRLITKQKDIVVKNVVNLDQHQSQSKLVEFKNWLGGIGAQKHTHGAGSLTWAMQEVRIARDEGWIDSYRQEVARPTNE